MSNPDPFQELVDSPRRVLLRSPTTMPSAPPPDAPPALSTSSATVPSSPMARPVPYSGGVEECNGFLLQCSLVFTMQPALYPTDQSQIAFITSLLTGPAVRWAETIWHQAGPPTHSIQAFIAHFKEVFSRSDGKLAALDDNMGLEKFIQQSLRCSDHMKSYQSNQETVSTAVLHPSEPINPSEPEPMIIESGKLTSAERQRRLTRGLCMYCGASGHVRLNCPLRPVRTLVSGIHSDIENMHPLTTNVQLTTLSSSVAVTALIDSGSAGNFISGTLCRQLQLRTEATSRIYQIQPITGEITSRTPIHRKCEPVNLQIGLLQKEDIQLLVLEGATMDIILGRLWLVKHDPILSWGIGEVIKWGEGCTTGSLPRPIQKSLPVYTTSVESPIEKQSVQIPDIYASYKDVFCPKRASQLPPHQPWDCAIDLVPDAPMPRGKIYPLSLPETKAMEEYIQEALSQGYIRPSTSPAASSFFFVAKKDGGLRPCIDYRIINQGTIKFCYPLPLVPAALEQLRSTRIFTKLDLRSAYNLVRIREGDEWKTAFMTPTGHYEYLVMSYGLVNAPSVFQNFIHEVLREFLHHFVIVYIDDILIYSRSEAEHCHHVAEVLQKLREHQLYLKAEKCSFHLPSVQFLGYIIDHQGVRMDERKLTAVVSWPEPTTIKELQRFLGFANFYRCFIQDYSLITAPLTNLLSGKPKTLLWTPEAAAAFHSLKSAFTQAPLLTHPDPELPFVVEVDASTTGVGAVLSQYHGTPKLLHPCAYFSRKLSPAERNYDIGNRELLAIKLALEEWLEGAIHPFQVITDHKNLQYFRDAKRLCPHQARWSLFFSRFNFSITYRRGPKNIRADALSRLHDHQETSETPTNIIPEHIIVSPIEWSAPPIVATPVPRPFVPRTQRVDLIHSTHTSLGTGHPGANNTLSLLSECFWWPAMARDVRRYVQGYKECAMSKSPRHLPAGKLHPLPIPNHPWSHLGVDFMTDLPSSDGNTCIPVIDRFSKFCRLLPLKGLLTALLTALVQLSETLFNHVFRYYGIPENIVSDRGPQFISRPLLWIPPSNQRQTERKIQEVGRFLRTFGHGHQDSWNQFLGWAEYAQNSLRQPTAGLHSSVFSDSNPRSSPGMVNHQSLDAAHHHLQRAVRRSKTIADRRRIPGPASTPGQKVWLSTRDIRLRLPSKKLSPRFVGPFTILEQVNPVTFKLQLPPQYRIHPTFHISLLKCFHQPLIPSTEPGHEEEPPPPLMLEEGSIYSVREILQSRCCGGQLEYLQKRDRGSPESTSWIPLSWKTSTPIILNTLHLVDEVDHHGAGGLGPQERALGRGVMSRIGQALQPLTRSDHSHQNSNHTHLHSISHTHIKAHTTHHSFGLIVKLSPSRIHCQPTVCVSSVLKFISRHSCRGNKHHSARRYPFKNFANLNCYTRLFLHVILHLGKLKDTDKNDKTPVLVLVKMPRYQTPIPHHVTNAYAGKDPANMPARARCGEAVPSLVEGQEYRGPEQEPPTKKRRTLGEDRQHHLALEVCDTIMCHAKERFSFTKHLVSATLLQGDLFPQHHKMFPDSALDTTVEAYPSLDKARLKTELSLIYSNEDLFILFIYFICETGDFEEEIKSLLLIVIIV
ncbi:hypothetical protein M9458_055580 [Cirrhinus mrigala]|uniref:Gypsy retrotransposon integrase-like protein 1 n=1 Tax=Cirrhinus mrigala TaxID=683832 RepID=A0ABD0MLV4_CIRMR